MGKTPDQMLTLIWERLDDMYPRLLLVEDQVIRWRRLEKYIASLGGTILAGVAVWWLTCPH